MGGYILGFTVYTLAILGVIFIGMVVVKKSLNWGEQKSRNNFLKVETSLNLEPRKNLYVIKAGKEKFLISATGEDCRFMTKLEDNLNKGTEAIQEYFNYGHID